MQGRLRIALALGALGCALTGVAPAQGATWSPATTISVPGDGDSANPAVAIDHAGYALVTWQAHIGDATVVRAAEHTPQRGWIPAGAPVASGLPGDISQTAGAVDARGNALVVWSQYARFTTDDPQTSMTIYQSTRAAGAAAWSAPRVLATGTMFDTDRILAATDDAGRIVVAWTTTVGPTNAVYGALGTAADGLAAPALLASSTLDTAPYALHAAVGPRGDVAVQWTEQSPDIGSVDIASAPPGGGFGATQVLETPAAGTVAIAGGVAFDASGDLLSIYNGGGDGTVAQITSRFRPAGGAFGPELAVVTNAASAGPAPVVALDGQGRATALWSIISGPTAAFSLQYPEALESATWSPGAAAWSAPVQLAGPITANGPVSQVAIATGGAAVATWSGGRDESSFVLTRDAGGAFSAAPAGCATVAIAIDDDGDAIQSCTSDDGVVVVETTDVSVPALDTLRAPPRPRAHRRQTFRIHALDAWQPLASRQIAWRFGDGSSGAGATVHHTYRKPGTYTVSVIATGANGLSSQRLSRRVRVSR